MIGSLGAIGRLGLQRGPSGLWTPVQNRPNLWFDGADPSTVVLNGSTASQVNSIGLSTQAITQAVASQQPVYNTAGLNSTGTLDFDGANDVLSSTNAPVSGVTNFSIFALMRFVATAGEDIPISIGNSGNARQVRGFYRANAGTTLGFTTWSNDIASSSLSCDIGGGYHLFEAVQSGQSVSLLRDGSPDSTYPRTLPQAPLAVNINSFAIGSLSGGSIGNYYSNISVAEVLIYFSAVSDALRNNIEGYMLWRGARNLQGNLPSDHPYRTLPPKA